MAIDDGRVVSNFCVQALQGKPLTIYGHGNHIRSFCYVSDTVNAIYRALINNAGFSGAINVGNPKPIDLNSLAELILNLAKSDSKSVYLDLPLDDPKIREPRIDRAREILKWEPTVDIRDGLTKTLEYFSKILLQ
jgi:UDP-glucuronate decarboxylase